MKIIAAALLTVTASAQTSAPVLKGRGDIDWKVSGSLPASGENGHDYHLVHEDKVTKGVQTLVRFSKGYALPDHSHSADEVLVILKGKLEVTLSGKTTTLGPGSYAVFPAGTVHALRAAKAVEMLVTFSGPVDFKGLAPAKPGK